MTNKRLPHEIALGRIENALKTSGLVVRDIVEEPSDGDDDSPHSKAWRHYLQVELAGYETVRIEASYKCLDTSEWNYSETELDRIEIIVHQEIAYDAEMNMAVEANRRFDAFQNEQMSLISNIKCFFAIEKGKLFRGALARLHFTFSVVLPSRQIRSYSVHKDV